MGHHFIVKLTRDGGPPPREELDSLMARAGRSPDGAAWLGTRKPGAGWRPPPPGFPAIAMVMDVEPATGAVDAIVAKVIERHDSMPDDLDPDARALYDSDPAIATWWRMGDPHRARLHSLGEIPGSSETGGLPASRAFLGHLSFVYWDFDPFDLLTGLLRSRAARAVDEAGEFVDSRWYPLPTFLTDDGHGDLWLKGHRISLYHVAQHVALGMDRGGLLEEFPTVPPALIDQVMRFCAANPGQIARYVARYAEEIEHQIASGPRQGPDLEELRRRHRERSGAKA